MLLLTGRVQGIQRLCVWVLIIYLSLVELLLECCGIECCQLSEMASVHRSRLLDSRRQVEILSRAAIVFILYLRRLIFSQQKLVLWSDAA